MDFIGYNCFGSVEHKNPEVGQLHEQALSVTRVFKTLVLKSRMNFYGQKMKTEKWKFVIIVGIQQLEFIWFFPLCVVLYMVNLF